MPVELKALQEANAALEAELEQQKAAMARLSEMLVLREAGDFARLVLAKVQLPEVTKTRLLKQLVTEAPIKDGRVDAASFATQIAEAVKVEQAYLAEAAGIGAGQISGFGDQGEWKPEDVEADLAESFRRMGLSDKVAEQAAKGRGEITRHGGNNG